MTFRRVSCASHKVFQNFISECVRGHEKSGNISKEGRRFQRSQPWPLPTLAPEGVCLILSSWALSALCNPFLALTGVLPQAGQPPKIHVALLERLIWISVACLSSELETKAMLAVWRAQLKGAGVDLRQPFCALL